MNLTILALISSLGMYNSANCSDYTLRNNGTVFEIYKSGNTKKLKLFIINSRHRTLTLDKETNVFSNELMTIKVQEDERGLKFLEWTSKGRKISETSLCFTKQLVHEQA